MDKREIISFIKEQIDAGKISREDIATLSHNVPVIDSEISIQPASIAVAKEESSNNLIHIFYGIGALITVIGVAVLISQNWNVIGFIGRITVSLGISCVAYMLSLILKNPEQKTLSQVLFTISAALAPLGAYVFLKEAAIHFSSYPQLITAIILTIVFGAALYISRKNILILITIAFASWAYYAFITKIFDYNYYDIDLLKCATMLLGASYLCISYGYQKAWPAMEVQEHKEKRAVQNILYGLGTLAILGAGISIGGVFDLFLIILIFGAFYGSVYLKSRSMLVVGALFLLAHIIKLTSKYFVDSIGWPIALIGIGFVVISIGYITYYLNKKFISEKSISRK